MDATLKQAIDCARKGSDIVVVGVFADLATINVGFVQDHELRLIGTAMDRVEDYLQAIPGPLPLGAGQSRCPDHPYRQVPGLSPGIPNHRRAERQGHESHGDLRGLRPAGMLVGRDQ